MKKNLLGASVVLIFLSLMSVVYIQHRAIKDLKEVNESTVKICDSLTQEMKVCDSIKSELFVKEIECGRYEYILDRADDELSKECKEELNRIESQTE
jgi:hypothetical protein